MKTRLVPFVTLAGLSLSAGCATRPVAVTIDLSSEEAAVRQTIQDWSAASNQAGEAGADAYVSFVTGDAVMLPPNEERREGIDAVREFVLGLTDSEGYTVHFEADRVKVGSGGDLAYAIGSYELSSTDAEGNLVEDKGKFLDVLSKQADGTWKASTFAFSSDLPVEGAAE